MDSAPFFCMPKETILDMANKNMVDRHHALPHPLETLAATPAPDEWALETSDDEQWMQSPTNLRGHALAQVDVYLDDFISTFQGGPTKRQQMLCHLFRSIDTFFQMNTASGSL